MITEEAFRGNIGGKRIANHAILISDVRSGSSALANVRGNVSGRIVSTHLAGRFFAWLLRALAGP